MFLRLDRVVPLAVKGIPSNLHQCEFFVTDLATLRIGVGVEFSLNLQASRGRGIGNQVDDYPCSEWVRRTWANKAMPTNNPPANNIAHWLRVGISVAIGVAIKPLLFRALSTK